MITPVIEKLLLTGRARYKRATVGLSGLMRINVPDSSAYIVTKIEVLPFFNSKLNVGDWTASEQMAGSGDTTPANYTTRLLQWLAGSDWQLHVRQDTSSFHVFHGRSELHVQRGLAGNSALPNADNFMQHNPAHVRQDWDCFFTIRDFMQFEFVYMGNKMDFFWQRDVNNSIKSYYRGPDLDPPAGMNGKFLHDTPGMQWSNDIEFMWMYVPVTRRFFLADGTVLSDPQKVNDFLIYPVSNQFDRPAQKILAYPFSIEPELENFVNNWELFALPVINVEYIEILNVPKGQGTQIFTTEDLHKL